jgi:hypothetical protein
MKFPSQQKKISTFFYLSNELSHKISKQKELIKNTPNILPQNKTKYQKKD